MSISPLSSPASSRELPPREPPIGTRRIPVGTPPLSPDSGLAFLNSIPRYESRENTPLIAAAAPAAAAAPGVRRRLFLQPNEATGHELSPIQRQVDELIQDNERNPAQDPNALILAIFRTAVGDPNARLSPTPSEAAPATSPAPAPLTYCERILALLCCRP